MIQIIETECRKFFNPNFQLSSVCGRKCSFISQRHVGCYTTSPPEHSNLPDLYSAGRVGQVARCSIRRNRFAHKELSSVPNRRYRGISSKAPPFPVTLQSRVAVPRFVFAPGLAASICLHDCYNTALLIVVGKGRSRSMSSRRGSSM